MVSGRGFQRRRTAGRTDQAVSVAERRATRWQRWATLCATGVLACSTSRSPAALPHSQGPRAAGARPPARCRYDVTPRDPRGSVLDVRLRCSGVRATRLRIASPMTGYVLWHAPRRLSRVGSDWLLPQSADELDLRYEVALGEAARSHDHIDVAVQRGGSTFAPASSWLVRPVPFPAGVDVPVYFDERTHMVTALRDAPGSAPGSGFRLKSQDLKVATYAAFGRVGSERIDVPDPSGAAHALRLAVLDGPLDVSREALRQWVRDSAAAVVRFWGRMPIASPVVTIVPVPGRDRVVFGKLLPAGGAGIALLVGEHATKESLYEDWILVHELFHMGSPSFVGEGKWLDEGLATYFEPLIRARAGWTNELAVWEEFAEYMPNGLRACEADGLEHVRDYAGVYWGGALIALLADAHVRERSDGQRGLEDGLRALLEAGGHASAVWKLSDAVATVDEALGAPVLATLARDHARRGTPTALESLFQTLGVEETLGGVRLRDDTDGSRVRRAILEGSVPRGSPPARLLRRKSGRSIQWP